MLPGHTLMPEGPHKGYTLARIISFHQDYVVSFLKDLELKKKYPNITDYFENQEPIQVPVAGAEYDPDVEEEKIKSKRGNKNG